MAESNRSARDPRLPIDNSNWPSNHSNNNTASNPHTAPYSYRSDYFQPAPYYSAPRSFAAASSAGSRPPPSWQQQQPQQRDWHHSMASFFGDGSMMVASQRPHGMGRGTLSTLPAWMSDRQRQAHIHQQQQLSKNNSVSNTTAPLPYYQGANTTTTAALPPPPPPRPNEPPPRIEEALGYDATNNKAWGATNYQATTSTTATIMQPRRRHPPPPNEPTPRIEEALGYYATNYNTGGTESEEGRKTISSRWKPPPPPPPITKPSPDRSAVDNQVGNASQESATNHDDSFAKRWLPPPPPVSGSYCTNQLPAAPAPRDDEIFVVGGGNTGTGVSGGDRQRQDPRMNSANANGNAPPSDGVARGRGRAGTLPAWMVPEQPPLPPDHMAPSPQNQSDANNVTTSDTNLTQKKVEKKKSRKARKRARSAAAAKKKREGERNGKQPAKLTRRQKKLLQQQEQQKQLSQLVVSQKHDTEDVMTKRSAEQVAYYADQLERLLIPSLPKPDLPQDKAINDSMTQTEKVTLFLEELRSWNQLHTVYRHADSRHSSRRYAAIECLAQAVLFGESSTVDTLTKELKALSRQDQHSSAVEEIIDLSQSPQPDPQICVELTDKDPCPPAAEGGREFDDEIIDLSESPPQQNEEAEQIEKAQQAASEETSLGRKEGATVASNQDLLYGSGVALPANVAISLTSPTAQWLQDNLLLKSPSSPRSQQLSIEKQVASLTDHLERLLNDSHADENKTDEQRKLIEETYELLRNLDATPRTRPLFPSAQERRTSAVMQKARLALASNGDVLNGDPVAQTGTATSQIANVEKVEATTERVENLGEIKTSGGILAASSSGDEVSRSVGAYAKQETTVKGTRLSPSRRQPISSPFRKEDNDATISKTASTLDTPTKRDIAVLYGDTDSEIRIKSSSRAAAPNTLDAENEVNDSGNAGTESTKKTALLKAKANLRKAMLAKKKALEQKRKLELARQQSAEILRPINALLKGGLDSLLITNISAGPVEKVRFMCLSPPVTDDEPEIAALGAEAKLLSNEDLSSESYVLGETTAGETAAVDEGSSALAKRKHELEQKLSEAKQKRRRLEAAAQKNDGNDVQELNSNQQIVDPIMAVNDSITEMESRIDNEENGRISDRENVAMDGDAVHKPTREELLKRKKEAERKRAINYYKHHLMKQEHLQAEQKADAEKTSASLEACSKELIEVEDRLATTRQNINTLNARKDVLDELMAQRVSELVKKRKQLHDLMEGGSFSRSSL